MLMSDNLQTRIKKYCELNNITIRKGKVGKKHEKEISTLINNLLKSDRNRNKIIEYSNAAYLKNVIPEAKLIIKELCESPIEEFMIESLICNGLYKFCVPQYKIGTKRVDFAFPEHKLVVECDGKKYHFTDKEQIERDQKRDKYLNKKGWMVLHFDGLIIRRNITACINEIKEYLNINC